jgi:HAD superfamily hydrolase (TIGR01490 family)
MRLAIFDLDHTLLPIDSCDTWSHYLVRVAELDAVVMGARIRAFARDYYEGRFDPDDYLRFQMGLLARFPRAQLEGWRARFVDDCVRPHVRAEALALVDAHRRAGDTLVLATGTHGFVAEPIAMAFGLPHLVAARPEERDGRFTGRALGGHTYGEGKLRAVEQFVEQQGVRWDELRACSFYSDSINDLPLLQRVAAGGGRAVVTNGDARLRRVAAERGWSLLDLFEPSTSGGVTAAVA